MALAEQDPGQSHSTTMVAEELQALRMELRAYNEQLARETELMNKRLFAINDKIAFILGLFFVLVILGFIAAVMINLTGLNRPLT